MNEETLKSLNVWLGRQTPSTLGRILNAVILRLIETEEIGFIEGGRECDGEFRPSRLYWRGSGEEVGL